MRNITSSMVCSLLLCSCSSLPQFYQAAEQTLTDNAIKIEVEKEALNQNTNLHIVIDLINKGTTP